MRLFGVQVRVKRSSVLLVVVFSLFAVSLLLVNRLDVAVTVAVDEDAGVRSGPEACPCRGGATPDYRTSLRTSTDDSTSFPHPRFRTMESNMAAVVGNPGHDHAESPDRLANPDADSLVQAIMRRGVRRPGSNFSLSDTRRTLDELKVVVRHMEEQLENEKDSTDLMFTTSALHIYNNNNTHRTVPNVNPDPVHEAAESVLQAATREEKLRSLEIAQHYRRLADSVGLDDDVIRVLRKAVAMTTGRGRKPRPVETIASPKVHRSNRRPWKEFDNSITQYALYRPTNGSAASSYVDRLLKNMASLPVQHIDEMADKGTQLKLILTLADGTGVLFKPMRISKDVESNPNHFVFNEMERHHSEIAAFHLDRVFDFRRVPPVAGRYINLTSQIIPFATPHLVRTFFISPVGNVCFYGDCKYYCDSHHAVCGNGDVIEGSAAVFLPSDDEQKGGLYPRKTWPNPWAQVYSKRGKLPPWKTRQNYCDEVRASPPYDSGRRLLDIMDMAMFDFLTGNLDRHHYYTFHRFGNDTYPILTDNGRGFGRPRKDDLELLAPIYQCCLIRASTLEKIVDFASATVETGRKPASVDRPSLSQAISRSLESDAIHGVLNSGHLAALDRRIRTVAIIVYDCLNRTLGSVGGARLDENLVRKIVVDDGF